MNKLYIANKINCILTFPFVCGSSQPKTCSAGRHLPTSALYKEFALSQISDHIDLFSFASVLDYSACQCIRGIIDLVARLSVSSGDELSISSFSLSRVLIAGDFPCGHVTNYRLSSPFRRLYSQCATVAQSPPRLTL